MQRTMESPQSHIVLVRHGETAWSQTGQHTGRTDIPLTDQGRHMAQRLGPALSKRSFTHVLSSPLQRAQETCKLAGLGTQMELCEGLVEWDYGPYEGRTTGDIQTEQPGWSLWANGVPKGETAEQVGQRVDHVIGQIRAMQGDVALFAHGHVLRVLAARWLGLHPTEGRLFALGTAAISILGYEHEQSVILCWNDRTHLREDDS